jgi:hypothetical protein
LAAFAIGRWHGKADHLGKALLLAGCLVGTWLLPVIAAAAGVEKCSDAASAPSLWQEFGAADPGLTQFHRLRRELRRAFSDGDYQRAKTFANQYLALASKYPCDEGYGDAIYSANLYLGRISLKDGDLTGAGNYLLEAGKTPGSMVLNSVGPDLTLADQLLRTGQTDTVVKFLLEVRAFWTPGQKQIDSWTAEIKAGKRPFLNPLEGAVTGTLIAAFSVLAILFLVPVIPALLVFLIVGRRLRRKWSFLVIAVVASYASVLLIAGTQSANKAAGFTLIAPALCACALYFAWRSMEGSRLNSP